MRFMEMMQLGDLSARISRLADCTTAIWDLNVTNQTGSLFALGDAENSAKAAPFNDRANN